MLLDTNTLRHRFASSSSEELKGDTSLSSHATYAFLANMNQIHKKMTMHANFEGSSQQENGDSINRKNGQGPQNLMFLLLVFLILRPKPNKRLLRARAQALVHDLHLIYLFVISLE